MAGSIALWHYLLRQPAGLAAEPPGRPDGRVIWIDVTAQAQQGAAAEVIGRIAASGTGLLPIVTGPNPPPLPGTALSADPGSGTLQAAERFLDHWRPVAGLVIGADLHPAMIEAATRRGVPLVLADAGVPSVRGGGWWPGLTRRLLRGFSHILARDDAAQAALRRAGAAPGSLRIGGHLVETGRALTCNEAERAAVARALGTRPAWLAVGTPASEEAMIAAAHQGALRMAHRLMLFLVPEDLDHAGRTAEALARDHGLSVARRSLDEEIEDDTQVYIADTEGELGLWYRLAPVAFFGGTLVPGGRPRHPFEAAALGAAILRGPALAADDPNRPVWDRLDQIGACRIVGDAGDLGDAVGDLLAPDRAAQMARAGWEASSAGTVAAERVVALLLATIGDGNGSRDQDAAPLPPSRPRAGKRRGRGA